MPSTFGLKRTRAPELESPANPWLTPDEPVVTSSAPPPTRFAEPELRPNPGISPPLVKDRLATRQVEDDELGVRLWWVAAHGGAGETTLGELVNGTRAAGHAWPLGGAHGPRDVVLLGRTSYAGLTAVRRALAHWGSGQIAVNLRALVLLADAPGKPPRPLRDLAGVLQQGAPGPACLIPWQPGWRLGDAQPSDVHKHLKPITPQEETQ
jgi:hypothetical protein